MTFRTRLLTSLAAVAGALCAAAGASAIDLSNNMAGVTAGTETAGGNRFLGASFGTDGSAHALTSVTLKMSASAGGDCILALYSNGGLRPGAPISILHTPAPPLPGALGSVVFTADSVALTPNTTYWLVLQPVAGEINWAWTASDAGSGAGFQKTWGTSDDAGAFWWSIDCYQTQMAVTVDECVGASIGGQPTSTTVCAGSEVQFGVTAGGSGTLSYQWRKDGTALADSKHVTGSATSTLTIHGATGDDIGAYTVVVSNGCGSATSNEAALGVCATDWDCNGTVNSTDVSEFINSWFSDQTEGTLVSDFDRNGTVNSTDVSEFINAWFGEVSQGCGG